MTPMFCFLAGLTVAGALAAMSLRNPVHCALCLVATFAGLAGIYLGLGAQFLGLAQVVVYIGAVAILLVFVMLLTRSGVRDARTEEGSLSWKSGSAIGGGVLLVLVVGVLSARTWPVREISPAPPPVVEIGRVLMTEYALPLQVVGVLLTAAMIGAAVLAMPERRDSGGDAGRRKGDA